MGDISDIVFSFGLISDIQFANRDGEASCPQKRYREALTVLGGVVERWSASTDVPIEFALHLGDIIDGNVDTAATHADLERVLGVVRTIPFKVHHVVGNHCLTVPRDHLLAELQLDHLGRQAAYYDFVAHNVRFVVLDCTDVSTYGWDKDTPNYRDAMAWLSAHPLVEYAHAESWNGGIGRDQLDWLRQTLAISRSLAQTVLVFGHIPILESASSKRHLLWNKEELFELLEDNCDVVNAYFAGHYHEGGYTVTPRGIHHVTVEAILEAPASGTAYGIVDVFEDKFNIRGYGSVPSRTCAFPSASDTLLNK